ncbi:AI-2E family transporter YdiK [Buchnera aphidicola]|uniref:AI-2E family transporter YdiK n=1 Tax=Buchnera aphidicola TaxID=9 RepID=UPI0031B83C7D
MKNPKDNMDLSQIIVLTILITFVILSSLYIISPFLKIFFWSSIIVISTWPIMLKIDYFLGGKRNLSIFFIIIFLLLLFFIPMFFFINFVIKNSILIIYWIIHGDYRLPNLNYLNDIPIFGTKFQSSYNNLIQDKQNNIICYFKPYIYQLIKFFIFQFQYFTKFIINLFFIFLLSCFLYCKGEFINSFIYNLSLRLNSNLIYSTLLIIGKSIRSVALGIVLTSFFHGFFAGIGLFIIGIPYSIFLIILIIFLSLIQIGSFPVLTPIIFWLYWKHYIFFGTFLLLWTVLISILDSIMRLFFIKIGINLPIFLIFFGVIGGFISFGMIGLFIGPVVLDMSYKIILSWIKNKSEKNLYKINKIKKK